jgi:hypothetical protein
MKDSLIETKTVLMEYLDDQILAEKENYESRIKGNSCSLASNKDSLLFKATFLKESNDRNRQVEKIHQADSHERTVQSASRPRDTRDSLLFRLSVMLQLCLV